jgi:tetratricopeptide (TPR) repeat protein
MLRVNRQLTPSWLYADGDQHRHLLSQPTYRSMSTIHEIMSSGKFHVALNALNKLLLKVRHRPYESAVVLQTLGYACHALGRDAQAIAYFEQCEQAILYVNKAIADTSPPHKSWYQLLLACYYELTRYKEAARVLEQLINHFPEERDYWIQLAGVYQKLNRDPSAAAILELAYRMDRLEETDMLRLVNLYMYRGMSYQAAQLLDTEMEKGRIKRTPGLRWS